MGSVIVTLIGKNHVTYYLFRINKCSFVLVMKFIMKYGK